MLKGCNRFDLSNQLISPKLGDDFKTVDNAEENFKSTGTAVVHRIQNKHLRKATFSKAFEMLNTKLHRANFF